MHHLVGHGLGLIFVIIGLTGSILAFWQTIDEQLNRKIMLVEPHGDSRAFRPVDEITNAARKGIREGGEASVLVMPRHARAAAGLYYEVKRHGDVVDTYQILIDPYTAKITGERVIQEGNSEIAMPFIQVMMSLHASLLLGHDNAFLVGFAGLLLLPALFAGLYLWWPHNGSWKYALGLKRGATRQRMLFDVHRVTGAWSFALLLLAVATGVCIIFRPQTRAILSLVSEFQSEPSSFRSVVVSGGIPITAAVAADVADKALAGGQLYSITFPRSAAEPFIIGLQSAGEPNRAATYRNVVIDQYSGSVLAIQDRSNFSAGERIDEWFYPLHCGEAFGNAGRAVVCALGLIPLVLYLTALLRWRSRTRAHAAGSQV